MGEFLEAPIHKYIIPSILYLYTYSDSGFESFFPTTRAQGFSCDSQDIVLTSATCNHGLTTQCTTSSLVGVTCESSSKYISLNRAQILTKIKQKSPLIPVYSKLGQLYSN